MTSRDDLARFLAMSDPKSRTFNRYGEYRNNFEAAVKAGGRIFTGKMHRDAVEKAVAALGPAAEHAIESDPENAFGYLLGRRRHG